VPGRLALPVPMVVSMARLTWPELTWPELTWPGLVCGLLVRDNGLTASLLTVSGLVLQVIGGEEQPRQAGQ
jgi:hypothetical protein